jgi:hypothetical protein
MRVVMAAPEEIGGRNTVLAMVAMRAVVACGGGSTEVLSRRSRWSLHARQVLFSRKS